MSITDAGTIRTTLYDRYVSDLGCANTTFIVPRDTNTLARLVERVVRPGDVVLDLGCGDGIATIHAVASGASHVVGIDVNPDAVSTARTNARRVVGRGGPVDPPGIISVEQMDMRTVLNDTAARDGVLQRCGLGGRAIDVVISNPPYVPMNGERAWQPEDVKAIQALPSVDLGVLGRSDALLERIRILRAAMITAEDGGPDGLRFVREILTHAPAFAARIAWLQASYTSPVGVLALLERSYLHIESLVAYAAPFGPPASAAPTPQHEHLSEMRNNGEAFFWSASPAGPHWMLLLGFSACRGVRPLDYDPPAVRASLCRLLTMFGARGPESLSSWRDELPFEMEVGCYEV